ncbi:outer membrane protein assembly factor [Halobacteriovorax sp. HLS]|uniref:outer membrane protein assembly factor n=1 Tax=Halobacteriovorax sp. HLS TaxID=2234000 RepID=UPI000FDC6E2F|nr:outer membrane protein assembly factor [Halobacteriovorax sp. HLS]
MVILRVFIFILFSFVVLGTSAKGEESVKSLTLNCSGDAQKCSDLEGIVKKKINEGLNLGNAREYFNLLLFDIAIARFSYAFNNENLSLNVEYYKKVSLFQIIHSTDIETKTLERLVGIREGSFYKISELEKAKEQVLNYFVERGYSNASIHVKLIERDSRVRIDMLVNTGEYSIVNEVRIVSTSSDESLELIKRRFNKFQNKVWNKIDIKFDVDRLSSDLFNDGYFSSTVSILPVVFVEKNKVQINLEVDLGEKHSFSFHGNQMFNHQEVLNMIKEGVKSNLGYFKESDLIDIVKSMYDNVGVFNTKISVYKNIGTDKYGQSFVNYFFNITEGDKIVINSLSFVGNSEISLEEIQKLYFNDSSVLISRGFLDRNYINSFSVKLKNKYLENGYVQANVSAPRVVFSPNKRRVDIEYRIKEKQQVIIEKLNLEGVPLKYREEIRKLLINKKMKPLNVLKVDEDIEKTTTYLKNKGYFFAEVKKLETSEVLQYDPSFSRATLNISVEVGELVTFNNSLVSGYSKTKKIVLDREIKYQKGDILTPSSVQNLKNRLSSLGLFSKIEIRPLRDKSNKGYNLLIQVQEKDFGQAYVAPGYRTDLGYKLSAGTNYNNIGGMNRVGSLRAQVNRRTSYRAFDPRRQSEQKDMLEYYVRANMTEPYFAPFLFGDQMEGDVALAVERKRYYEFDADRYRIAPSLSKSFNKIFSASLKYQWERINQYDASSAINNDDFNIGGITPGFSLDFRDDPIKPTKGAFFSLSSEFANPFFGSMNNESIIVNYYKLVSRNRIYVPIQNFVFAFSGSFGVQQNFSSNQKFDENGQPIYDEDGNITTDGYIPSIKVFRLNGVDLVRGYAEDEINILPDGRDIGDVIIRDKAYFVNLKFEARYSVNDSLIIGPFFDAGRVFVNNIDMLDLRSSVGLTLKYVTPVGTLDFDYGIKTHRMKHLSGLEESFGRFHLSIGFF